MSDSELVIVDTADMIDPFEGEENSMSPIPFSENTGGEINSLFKTEQEIESEEKPVVFQKKKKRTKKGNIVQNFTYNNNPNGVLIKSGFDVKSQFEEIEDSTEKKFYFSVEGYEISLKFPMRVEDRNSEKAKKIAAQKAIDFILSLDRVPTRLSELMTVPNKSTQLALRVGAKNPVQSTSEFRILTKQGNPRQVLIRKTPSNTNSYEHFRDVCKELVEAGLTPQITFVRGQDMGKGVDAQFATRLPNYEIEFFGQGFNRMSAKLASVSKALKYARKHGFGNFSNSLSLSLDSSIPTPTPHHKAPTFRRPSSPRFNLFGGPRRDLSDPDIWDQPQKKHVSVHSRLAPPLPANLYGNPSAGFQRPYPSPDPLFPSNDIPDRYLDRSPYFDAAPSDLRDSVPFPFTDTMPNFPPNVPHGNAFPVQSHGFHPYGQWNPTFDAPRGFKRSVRRGKKF